VNTKYLYLILNLATFAIPFAFSFHPKTNFSKKWKFVIPGILLTALFFVIWDEFFIRMGVWGFNGRYLSGIYILNLPIEEILFFICIPYACFFTYFAINQFLDKDRLLFYQEIISLVIILSSFVVGFYHLDKWYTSVTFLSISAFLSFQLLKLRPNYMGRFYFSFIVLLIPFFIVNGILTGSLLDEPVVWYNNSENLGLRVGTIPVEDIFYALLMLVMSISIAEKLEAVQSA
jgi:lycopene cyclase domain-containing protein